MIASFFVWPFLLSYALGQGNCTKKDGSTRPDCPQAIAFFRGFQAALSSNDRSQVAALVSYPVRITLRHKPARIKNAAQFLAHYDEIFGTRIRCAILNATDEDVWGNWQGFTVDGGPVWFDGIIPPGEHPDIHSPDYWSRYSLKIVAINNDAYFKCKSAPESPR
ncbi:MAG TPA: hypothetical protein VFA85_12990 [Terriglobales bacterium]|nr:hypothetical protein [Terriglobales bacterium]